MKKLGIILLLSGVCLSFLVSCEDQNKKKNNNLLLLGAGAGTGAETLEAPSMVDATDGVYTDAIGLNWKAVSNVAGYSVYRSESAEGPFDKIGSIDTAAYETGMQAGGTTVTPVTPPVTPPDPTPTEAVFQSDVNLSGLMFDIGVFVLAWQTPKIKIVINGTIEGIAEFPGGWIGALYTRNDVVARINEAVGKTICYPVDSGSNRYVKIVSTSDTIVISNANTTLSYIPLKYFLKSDATKDTVITVKPEPAGTGGDTGGGSTGGGTTIPVTTYNFVDKSVTQGKHYYYIVTSMDDAGLESDYSVIDEGFAVSSDAPAKVQNTKATDGTSATTVTVTWDTVPGASYYRVYRYNGKTTVQVGGDITTGTSYDDTAPAGLLSYKVAAYNAFAEGPYSDPDAGYRTVTNEEFYVEFARSMDYSLGRLTKLGSQGSETITAQKSNGTLYYEASGSLSGAHAYLIFTNFCDIYMTFNGAQKTEISDVFSKNGTLSGKDSQVNVTGIYNGYVRYDLIISGGAPSGGNYYVSQDGGAETTIPWNYSYK